MKASLSQYLELSQQTGRIVEHFKNIDQIDMRSTVVTVKNIALTLTQNLPALVWLTRIKHEDKYTAEHCLNVCVLAMGLATSLGWSAKDTAQVGVAGLLHDLGKIDLDHDLLNKAGKLTPEEFGMMKTHPDKGFKRLENEPDLNHRILNGIRYHHERPDGRGYPKGLKADEIDDMAKIVAIVDAYDAITSDRVYQKARSHHEAMSILWRMRDKQFDAYMVEAFIHFLGWVTPGTLVELSSGDIAVVIQAMEGQRLYPIVRILMPTNLGYTLGATWNLTEMPAPTGEPKIHIANVLPDGYLGIRIENFANRLFD
jgi:HD-GYP domain-containing protein (c-di-GMP phosphodiesterase class II)